MKLFQLKLNYSHIKKNHKSYYLMYVYTYYCLGFLLWYRIVFFVHASHSVPIDVVLLLQIIWTTIHHNFHTKPKVRQATPSHQNQNIKKEYKFML